MGRLLTRAALLISAAALGASSFAAIHWDPSKMMLASEVQAGEIGTALTVFKGVTPTKFHVRILGVIPKGGPGGEPYIIFRIIDGPVVERDSPVMGGMSGSPVFINGKIIGAIAYTYLYEKEPCGGITPIQAMVQGVTGERVAEACPTQPVRLADNVFTSAVVAGQRHGKVGPHTMVLRTCASPIYFTAGASGGGNPWTRCLYGLLGLDARPGAGVHAPVPVSMEPGCGFGVGLATGDLLSYTFGTVTWRDGNQLIAFGHPFMSSGKCSLPMTSVYIYDFVPNYRRTDKDGVIMGTVGAMDYDCPWAVEGAVGQKAQTVPAVYRVVDETGDRSHVYQVNLCKNRAVTSSVALGSMMEALSSVYYADKPGIVRYHYTIHGTKGAVIERSDIASHDGDPAPPLGSEISDMMRLLTDNRFEPQDIAGISVDARIWTEEDVARIERVYTEEQAAVAGHKLTVHIVLKPVDKPDVDKVVTFDLPANLPKGAVQLGIAGGEMGPDLRQQLGGFTPEFHSLSETISYLESLETNNQLLVMLALPTQGAAVEDTPLPDLPTFLVKRLAMAHRTGVRAIKDYDLKTLDTPWVIEGSYATSLATVNAQGERGQPTPPSGKKEQTSAGADKFRSLVNSVAMGTVPVLNWSDGKVEAARLVQAGLMGESVGAGQAMVQDAQMDVDEDQGADAEQSPDADSDTGSTAAKKETKKEGAKAEAKKPKPDEGKVEAKPQDWALGKYDELAKGQPEGLAVQAKGWLVPGMRLKSAATLSTPLVWGMAAGAHATYLAAGLGGSLYRLQDGKVSTFFTAPKALFISCVALLPNGTVACAQVPKAKLFFLGPDGKIQRTVSFDEGYIWALLPHDGGLLVGTGHPARVYSLSASGDKKLLAAIPEDHVTALAAAGKYIYAATTDRSVLYRIGPGGALDQLLEMPGGDCTGVCALPDGKIVVSASKAAILAVLPDGSVQQWYKKDSEQILALAPDGNAVVAAVGTPAKLIRASGPDDYELLALDRDQDDYSDLARRPDGQLVVAGCSPGVVLDQDLKPAELVYTSGAHDASWPARWLRAFVDSDLPAADLKLQTRTGSTPRYKSGLWSSWSDCEPTPTSYLCASPLGRYLQVRVTVSPSAAGPVRGLVVRYYEQNRAPTLKVSEPASGVAVSGEKEVKWTASDPDKDSVDVSVLLQAKDGKDWTTLAQRQTGSSYKWDTKKTKDGVYRLKVVATDRPSRPVDPATTDVVVAPLIVDNTAPEASVASGPQLQADGAATLEVLARDTLSGVAGVTWQYPDSDVWYAAAPADGLWGGEYEVASLTLPASIKAGTRVTVRVRDLAGNVKDLTVTMPGEAKAKKAGAEKAPAEKAPAAKTGESKK